MEVICTTGCVTARPLAHFNLLFSTLCHEARMGSGAKDMRAERDRFVAFAFSAADLMLEIAGDGSVLFVSGAARLLTGEDSDRLTGRQFSSLIDEADRHFILHLLDRLTLGGRIEPVTERMLKIGRAHIRTSVPHA